MGEWKRLWREESGAIVTAELILIGTILGLGLIPAYATLRNTLANEFWDTASCMSAYDTGSGWWGEDNDHDGHDGYNHHGDGHSHHKFGHVTTAASILGH